MNTLKRMMKKPTTFEIEGRRHLLRNEARFEEERERNLAEKFKVTTTAVVVWIPVCQAWLYSVSYVHGVTQHIWVYVATLLGILEVVIAAAIVTVIKDKESATRVFTLQPILAVFASPWIAVGYGVARAAVLIAISVKLVQVGYAPLAAVTTVIAACMITLIPLCVTVLRQVCDVVGGYELTGESSAEPVVLKVKMGGVCMANDATRDILGAADGDMVKIAYEGKYIFRPVSKVPVDLADSDSEGIYLNPIDAMQLGVDLTKLAEGAEIRVTVKKSTYLD